MTKKYTTVLTQVTLCSRQASMLTTSTHTHTYTHIQRVLAAATLQSRHPQRACSHVTLQSRHTQHA